MFAVAEMNLWPFIYRPTSPELFARPFGNRAVADNRSTCELQQYPDATTNVFARYSIGSLGRSWWTPCAATTVGRVSSSISRRISVRSCSTIFLGSINCLNVKSGE